MNFHHRIGTCSVLLERKDIVLFLIRGMVKGNKDIEMSSDFVSDPTGLLKCIRPGG